VQLPVRVNEYLGSSIERNPTILLATILLRVLLLKLYRSS
jgi:hypothetical protein